MHISCKPWCFFILLFLAFVLPFTHCTAPKGVTQLSSTNDDNNVFKLIYQVNHHKTYDIALHGLLLWASMGFLLPLGILSIRMSNKEAPSSRRGRVFFYVHVSSQMLAVLLATVGGAISLKKFENSFDNTHQRLGLALYAAILLQIFIGFFRPQRERKARNYWYFVHWILGTIVSLVSIISTYTGLKAYHKRTLKSTKIWNIVFTAQVSFFALVYLLQDKLEYLKKQGVILASDESTVSSNEDIPIRRNHKEFLPLGSCFWKSDMMHQGI